MSARVPVGLWLMIAFAIASIAGRFRLTGACFGVMRQAVCLLGLTLPLFEVLSTATRHWSQRQRRHIWISGFLAFDFMESSSLGVVCEDCCEPWCLGTQCCCLVCLRPDRARRLIAELYPRYGGITGQERGLTGSNVEDIVDLAKTRTSKVSDLGTGLKARVQRDLFRERPGYVEVSLQAVNAVIDIAPPALPGLGRSSASADLAVLEVFEIHARAIISLLLESKRSRLCAGAATTVSLAPRALPGSFPAALAQPNARLCNTQLCVEC